jgi:hypothetical protein
MTFSRQDIGVACILPSMRVTACSLCNQASEGRVAAMKIQVFLEKLTEQN